MRLGRDAYPRSPAEAWVELKVPPGSWALSGRLGLADLPSASSVVLFLEIVQDHEVVLWRGTIRSDGFVDVPSVRLPLSADVIELHAGFESDRGRTILILDLGFDPV